jgi:hypothetical protein
MLQFGIDRGRLGAGKVVAGSSTGLGYFAGAGGVSDAFMQVESHVDRDLDIGQPPPKPLGLEDCTLLFVFNKSLK